ncbi:hypothetical protein [Paenibacillus silviterrae]|uniref:hypothetical protein n=1 Tax=Paenibacillus silviterrae TaxID=3242194 RepID=UPI002542F043|nr:hypothetical protein [Paenibacillus chinjuensis]
MMKLIIPNISAVADTPNLFTISAGLQTKDEYAYRHNVGFTFLSNMIGKWLSNRKRSEELRLVATFHDIGLDKAMRE